MAQRSSIPKRMLRILLPIALLLAGGLGAWGLVLLRPRVEAAPPAERVWTVEVVRVQPGDIRPTLRRFGRLVAARELELKAAVGGRVLWVAPSFVEGGRVEAGELLVRLDPLAYRLRLDQLAAEREQAAIALRELEAELRSERRLLALVEERVALAEREVERQERLVGRGVAPPKSVDAARRELIAQRTAREQSLRRIELLELRLERQRAVIARLDAEIRKAERDLADTELRAPFAGIVLEARIAEGRELRPGEPVGRLAAKDRLEIAFSVSDAEFGRLWREGLIGRELVAVWRTGESRFRLRARVARLQGRIRAESAGVGLFARIEADLADVPIRPGAFLELELPDVLYREAVRLPASALFEGDTVFVVDAEGRLQARKVRLLARDGGDVILRGELRAGERVVVTRLAEIGPGLRVTALERGG